MASPARTVRRSPAALILVLFLTLTTTAVAKPQSQDSQELPSPETEIAVLIRDALPLNLTDHITIHAAQTATSSCTPEGQWNCMTSSWQRCASGRWSVVMQMAAGTVCVPEGLTTDFRIQSTAAGAVFRGDGGVSTADGGRKQLLSVIAVVGLWLGFAMLLS